MPFECVKLKKTIYLILAINLLKIFENNIIA